MLEVGSAQAAPGTKGQGVLRIGTMAMGMPVDIPVLIVNGIEPGPVFWLNGAVHGDELNGFMAVRELAHALDPKVLRGALICTPLCNPLAVQWRNKVNPWDLLDLDQQFPGQLNGQYSQRTASLLFSAIREHATHLLSFHTVGHLFRANPYTVYKFAPGVAAQVAETGESMALAFGVGVNCRVDLSTAKGEVPGGVGGSLDINCARAGIPSFMAEVGHGGCFEAQDVAVARQGICNVMKSLGMIDAASVPLASTPELSGKPERQRIVTKRGFLYTSQGGFWSGACAPGDLLTKGQSVGRLFDLFTDLDQVKSPEDALVIMVRHDPVAHVGDRLGFFGYAWEDA